MDGLSRVLGTALFWVPVAMVLVTLLVIVLRYVFQFSVPAMQEVVVYLYSAIIALTAGMTLERNGHARIDFLYRKWSPRRQAWIDLLGAVFLLLPFCLVLMSYCLDYVLQSWRVREISPDTHGLPFVYLQKSLLLMLPVLLLLQGVSTALGNLTLLLSDEAE